MKKYIIPAVLICLACISFFMPKISIMNNKTQQFLNNSLKQTFVSYATVRTINAAVSIIKHSSLDADPAGIGITIGAGEILDPLNDLAERVSDVLFISSISMGVMNVIYQISLPVFNILIGIILILFALSFFLKKEFLFKTIQILMLIASIRLIFPIASFGGDYVNNYFTKEINNVLNNLKTITFHNNNVFNIPQQEGFFGRIEAGISLVKTKINEVKDDFSRIQKNHENIINDLIKLAYLYIGLFLINIIIIPLFLFWLFKKIILGIEYRSKKIK